MKAKKTPKADLQNKKTVFFEIGLAVSILAVLLAFQYSTEKEIPPVLTAGNRVELIDEHPPITRPDVPQPEIKQIIQVPEVIDIIDEDPDIDFSGINFDPTESNDLLNKFGYINRPAGNGGMTDEPTVVEKIPFALLNLYLIILPI